MPFPLSYNGTLVLNHSDLKTAMDLTINELGITRVQNISKKENQITFLCPGMFLIPSKFGFSLYPINIVKSNEKLKKIPRKFFNFVEGSIDFQEKNNQIKIRYNLKFLRVLKLWFLLVFCSSLLTPLIEPISLEFFLTKIIGYLFLGGLWVFGMWYLVFSYQFSWFMKKIHNII